MEKLKALKFPSPISSPPSRWEAFIQRLHDRPPSGDRLSRADHLAVRGKGQEAAGTQNTAHGGTAPAQPSRAHSPRPSPHRPAPRYSRTHARRGRGQRRPAPSPHALHSLFSFTEVHAALWAGWSLQCPPGEAGCRLLPHRPQSPQPRQQSQKSGRKRQRARLPRWPLGNVVPG